MKDSVVIPSALQICLDDVMWHEGEDMRYKGLPSRTGMPRKHLPSDYTVINEIGKGVNMKILCLMCLAEWDKDNFLTHEIGTTYQPHTWDRASKIDMEYAKKCFEIAESSEYIEYGLHGLNHGNYDEQGRQITEIEYFEYKDPNSRVISCQSEEEILHRFELFFKIYDSWGFKKKIRAFGEPNEPPKYIKAEDVLPLANALKKYGISYWMNYWMSDTVYFDSILYMAKSRNVCPPWNAYDVDPTHIRDFVLESDEKEFTILGLHWPNFLRFDEENNMQSVPLWINYLKRQSEIFGLMLSRDIAFAGNQHIYRRLSKTDFFDKKMTIDVSGVYKQKSITPDGRFCLSVKNGLTPMSGKGCSFKLYEKHNDFCTYEIEHTEKQMEIIFE